MDPRSLVGWTEGAKKRAARLSVSLTWEEGECWEAEYQCARERYRVGQRLRSCPYCRGPAWIESMRCPAVSRTWLVRPPLPPCDGSGVITKGGDPNAL